MPLDIHHESIFFKIAVTGTAIGKFMVHRLTARDPAEELDDYLDHLDNYADQFTNCMKRQGVLAVMLQGAPSSFEKARYFITACKEHAQAKGLEIDIQLSFDGKVIIYDKTLVESEVVVYPSAGNISKHIAFLSREKIAQVIALNTKNQGSLLLCNLRVNYEKLDFQGREHLRLFYKLAREQFDGVIIGGDFGQYYPYDLHFLLPEDYLLFRENKTLSSFCSIVASRHDPRVSQALASKKIGGLSFFISKPILEAWPKPSHESEESLRHSLLRKKAAAAKALQEKDEQEDADILCDLQGCVSVITAPNTNFNTPVSSSASLNVTSLHKALLALEKASMQGDERLLL